MNRRGFFRSLATAVAMSAARVYAPALLRPVQPVAAPSLTQFVFPIIRCVYPRTVLDDTVWITPIEVLARASNEIRQTCLSQPCYVEAADDEWTPIPDEEIRRLSDDLLKNQIRNMVAQRD